MVWLEAGAANCCGLVMLGGFGAIGSLVCGCDCGGAMWGCVVGLIVS